MLGFVSADTKTCGSPLACRSRRPSFPPILCIIPNFADLFNKNLKNLATECTENTEKIATKTQRHKGLNHEYQWAQVNAN